MYHTHHSIGTSLHTHGVQGVETYHKANRFMEDVNVQRLIDAEGAPSGLRHRIGGLMITLGATVAGRTHDIQGRQATMPSPAAKSGFVPTR